MVAGACNWVANFIWGIADDVMRDLYVRGKYRDVTIADCFRFMNKIGLDVALEALTDSWRSRRLKLDELTQIATKLRIQRVMQPYLETIVM